MTLVWGVELKKKTKGNNGNNSKKWNATTYTSYKTKMHILFFTKIKLLCSSMGNTNQFRR